MKDLGTYHIATIAQLSELPSSIAVNLGRLPPFLEYPFKNTAPGMTVRTPMYGETISIAYDVAQHLIVMHKLGGYE